MQSSNKKIPLIKHTFYEESQTKHRLVEKIMVANKLSMGHYCECFEEDFKNYQNRKHAVLVNSGSSANLALIQALLNLGVLELGDRIGFSALTWATNVMPIIQLGLTPVPIDVEIETLNVSLNKLKKAKDLKALFITNLLGACDNLDEIEKYCKEKKITLLEDNCESLGSKYKGKLLGNFSLASTFSFYVGHQLSTIEGGMICTDDAKLADMLKMVRAHGWKRDTKNYSNDFYGRYTFYDLGYNLRPTEITGILGSIQLEMFNWMVYQRQTNFDFLKDVYKQKGVYNFRTNHLSPFSSFSIPIVAKSVEKRDEMLERAEEVMETRPIVGGNITEQPFFEKYAGSAKMPNAELIHRQGFYVANNPDLSKKDLKTMKETLCPNK
jgi:CDP-4-dehydro-6-deoxyglucose reductase, E1